MIELSSQVESSFMILVKKYLPYLVLFVGVIGTSMSSIFIRWANAPGPMVGFYRMLIAIGIFAIPVSVQFKHQATISNRHLVLAAIGGVFFGISTMYWNISVLNTSAANATLIANTSVIWVSLGALYFFKETLKRYFWVGILIALVGMAIIFGKDFITHPTLGLGDFYALIAGLFYTVFFLIAKRAREQTTAFIGWWISSLSSTITLLVICVVMQTPLTGYSLQTYISIGLLALVTQVIGMLSTNYAMGHLPVSIISPTLLMQPVIAATLAIPLLGQSLELIQIAGGVLVLTGIVIVNRSK